MEAANARGFGASQGLIEKYVTRGLLDRGTQRGNGQGLGPRYLWPENQLQLFLLLLEKRDSVGQLRVLANFPVAIWLYWGETYVPLRQLRRVLKTWAGVKRYSADAMANWIVAKVADPKSKRIERETAADAIAEFVRNPEHLDDVAEALEPILGLRDPSKFTDAPRAAELLAAQVAATYHAHPARWWSLPASAAPGATTPR